MAIGKVRIENGQVALIFDQSAQEIFDGMDQVRATKARRGLVIIEGDETLHPDSPKPLVMPALKPEGMLTHEQGSVLQKLISLRFEERTPSNVQDILSQKETGVFSEMIDSGLIKIYKGGKYAKNGVISIPESIFPKIPKGDNVSSNAKAQPVKQQAAGSGTLMQRIEKTGYVILENDTEAKEASNALSSMIKDGKIKGVRAFDRRYYIASKEFYDSHRPNFLDRLEKAQYTPEAIAKALSVDEQAAMVMLALMSNEGEALEKRKGFYSHA